LPEIKGLFVLLINNYVKLLLLLDFMDNTGSKDMIFQAKILIFKISIEFDVRSSIEYLGEMTDAACLDDVLDQLLPYNQLNIQSFT
jgi:hypothetical protein